MSKEELKNNLKNIRNTLNTVSVSGAENMNRLLGCIMMLDKDIQAVDALTVEEAPDENS